MTLSQWMVEEGKYTVEEGGKYGGNQSAGGRGEIDGELALGER
jgi:hypothetical protein